MKGYNEISMKDNIKSKASDNELAVKQCETDCKIIKNAIIELTADNIAEDGSGVGRYNGMVVFCRGLLPGESASVRIIKVTKSYAIGRMLSLNIPSPHRLEPPVCPHFTKGCGGCAFSHFDMESQLAYKRQRVIDCLVRIGGFAELDDGIVQPVIAADSPFGYRNKSIYPFAELTGEIASEIVSEIAYKNPNLICGFYALNSHRVVPLGSGKCGGHESESVCGIEAGCGIENEMSRQIRNFTLNFARKHGMTAYDEASGRGLLRALMVRTNHGAAMRGGKDEAMAVLVINERVPKDFSGNEHGDKKCTAKENAKKERTTDMLLLWADELTAALSFVKSVWICFNRRNTNVVLDGDIVHVCGEKTICDAIGSFVGAPHFEISPLSFYQVNPAQTEKLYSAVYDFIPKDARLIYDIYCGIGTIGIYIAARMARSSTDKTCSHEIGGNTGANAYAAESGAAKMHADTNTGVKIVGVECVPSAVEDARENAAENGIKNAFYYCGDASDVTPRVIEEHGIPSVIILDPPRKGCDTPLLDTVIASGVQNIIYVSCNPATLARDLKILCAAGYEIKRVQPVDMFPQSGHVETVCLLSKLNVKQHIEIELTMDEMDLTAPEKEAAIRAALKHFKMI